MDGWVWIGLGWMRGEGGGGRERFWKGKGFCWKDGGRGERAASERILTHVAGASVLSGTGRYLRVQVESGRGLERDPVASRGKNWPCLHCTAQWRVAANAQGKLPVERARAPSQMNSGSRLAS